MNLKKYLGPVRIGKLRIGLSSRGRRKLKMDKS